MITRLLNPLLVIAALLTLSATAAPPPDAEAAKLLVGSWVLSPGRNSAIVKDAGFTFRSGRMFTSYAVLHIQDEDVRVEVEGKWSVKDSLLIEELTKSNHPEVAPVGLVTRDTLLAVTEKEYRSRTESGAEERYVRRGDLAMRRSEAQSSLGLLISFR